jgi:hypothetical protein
MRFVLSFVAVAVAFFVVLLGGGSAVGLWDELELPESSAAADDALRALAPAPGKKAPPKPARKKQSRADEEKAKAERAKRRWASAANRICRRAARETEDAEWALESPRTVADAERLIARVAELNARYNDLIRALPVPTRESDRIAKLMRILDREEAAVDLLLEAIRDRDVARMTGAKDRLLGIADRQSIIMYDLGAYDCAL